MKQRVLATDSNPFKNLTDEAMLSLIRARAPFTASCFRQRLRQRKVEDKDIRFLVSACFKKYCRLGFIKKTSTSRQSAYNHKREWFWETLKNDS